jgi:hypothetical protein
MGDSADYAPMKSTTPITVSGHQFAYPTVKPLPPR